LAKKVSPLPPLRAFVPFVVKSSTSTAKAPRPVTAAQVRRDFNDLRAVVHYTKAAHELGLWASERIMLERVLPPPPAAEFPILEAGCGAGRISVGLHGLGYRHLTGFDFARELFDQAEFLAAERSLYGDLYLAREYLGQFVTAGI
jgi:2-polyprenyl-3-methyl-5-hydroxy-6-metoxy-1,4-benzoquinol methylase